MHDLLGDEAGSLLDAIDEPRPPAVRLNHLRGQPDALAEHLPWPSSPVPWCPAGRVVSASSQEVATAPLNDAGVYYQQDPAAMAVAQVLAPRKGELVVDVAAAPGGKTTHAAGLTGDSALIVANDLDEGRARSLLGNVERLGVTSAVVTNGSVERLVGALGSSADAVILDAPCSGEGMFRRSAAARDAWSPGAVERHADLQRRLISQAALLVAPGGRLVYSTCTFDPRENEDVVSWLLARRPDLALEPIRLAGTSDAGRFGLPGAARVWPHLSPGDGHFLALLVRDPGAGPADHGRSVSGGAGQPGRSVRDRRRAGSAGRSAGSSYLKAWREFATDHLEPAWRDLPRVERYGKHLLALPERFAPLPGVHVMRAGLHLGDIVDRGGTTVFEPAHALAMAATAAWRGASLDLEEDADGLTRFRAGGAARAGDAKGICLVTYRGFPLGFARAKGGEARSLLPRGLRRPA